MGKNESIKPNIEIKNRPEELSPRVDELTHDALSMELEENHPQMDRKTDSFLDAELFSNNSFAATEEKGEPNVAKEESCEDAAFKFAKVKSDKN